MGQAIARRKARALALPRRRLSTDLQYSGRENHRAGAADRTPQRRVPLIGAKNVRVCYIHKIMFGIHIELESEPHGAILGLLLRLRLAL
jgi:hypothetical protein